MKRFKWFTDFGFSQFGIPPRHKAGPTYDTLSLQFKSTQAVAPCLFTHWELYIHPATQAYCVGKSFCHLCTNKHYKVRYIRHKPEQSEPQVIHVFPQASKIMFQLLEQNVLCLLKRNGMFSKVRYIRQTQQNKWQISDSRVCPVTTKWFTSFWCL